MTTSYTLVQMIEKMHEKSNKVWSIIRAKESIRNTRVKDLIATDRACS